MWTVEYETRISDAKSFDNLQDAKAFFRQFIEEHPKGYTVSLMDDTSNAWDYRDYQLATIKQYTR